MYEMSKEEKLMNLVMFLFDSLIPITGYVFVMRLMNGTKRDSIVWLLTVGALLTRALERKLGKYAKYIYICVIPVGGALSLAFINAPTYMAMTHSYFVVTALSILYFDSSVIAVNIGVTVAVNGLLVFTFPEAFMKFHAPAIWGFILYLYIMIAIAGVWIVRQHKKLNQEIEEYRMLEQQIEDQKYSVIQMKEYYEQIHILKHDIKHYFQCVYGMLEQREEEKAQWYLREVMTNKIENIANTVYTESIVLNAVLNTKITAMKELGIQWYCNVAIDVKKINEVDVSVILANLLDNAIEACKKNTQERMIKIMLREQKNMIHVQVTNTIEQSVLEENAGLKTTKKDKKKHGYGILSVKKLAQEHDGLVKHYEEGNEFVTQVLLKKIQG